MKLVRDSTKVLANHSQDAKMVLYAMIVDWLQSQERVIPVNFLSLKTCSSRATLIKNVALDLNAVMVGILFQFQVSILEMFANIY